MFDDREDSLGHFFVFVLEYRCVVKEYIKVQSIGIFQTVLVMENVLSNVLLHSVNRQEVSVDLVEVFSLAVFVPLDCSGVHFQNWLKVLLHRCTNCRLLTYSFHRVPSDEVLELTPLVAHLSLPPIVEVANEQPLFL